MQQVMGPLLQYCPRGKEGWKGGGGKVLPLLHGDGPPASDGALVAVLPKGGREEGKGGKVLPLNIGMTLQQVMVPWLQYCPRGGGGEGGGKGGGG